jgi:hypothetical protein
LLLLLVLLFHRELILAIARPSSRTKGCREEEKKLYLTDTFPSSALVSPGCQSFVSPSLQLTDQPCFGPV